MAAAPTAASAALHRVGLAGDGLAVPQEMSGGQAQRAAVARALVTSPRLVFADEPVASLDTQGGREVLDLLFDVARSSDGAVVLVTHDNTVAALADREVRLHEGVISHDAVLR